MHAGSLGARARTLAGRQAGSLGARGQAGGTARAQAGCLGERARGGCLPPRRARACRRVAGLLAAHSRDDAGNLRDRAGQMHRDAGQLLWASSAALPQFEKRAEARYSKNEQPIKANHYYAGLVRNIHSSNNELVEERILGSHDLLDVRCLQIKKNVKRIFGNHVPSALFLVRPNRSSYKKLIISVIIKNIPLPKTIFHNFPPPPNKFGLFFPFCRILTNLIN